MTNKVKINRFERSIPTNENGILKVNENATDLTFINPINISEKYNLSNSSKGLTLKISGNQLIIKKGYTYLDKICDYFLHNNQTKKQDFHLKYPLWDITSTYQFQPMDLNIGNYETRYSTLLYNTNGAGGIDSSSGTTLKHYLCHIKNYMNEFDMVISSYADKPIMNEGDTLLYYIPIETGYHLKKILDKKFIEFENDTIIDLTTAWSTHYPLMKYEIWLNENKEFFITYGNEFGNIFHNKLKCKKIGDFITASDNADNIIRYYPMEDLASSYQSRYIIKEQSGTTGYRIYSDGWKEQWGNLVNPVFPVAFNEIPLSVVRGATAVTRTGMTIAAGYWFAKGY